jgi:endonuclease-3
LEQPNKPVNPLIWLFRSFGTVPHCAANQADPVKIRLAAIAFPVDTHVHRVTGRLGLIPSKTSAEQAHDLLEALVPPGIYFPFHVNLIRHGREICRARSPRCEVCPLKDLCVYFQSLGNP